VLFCQPVRAAADGIAIGIVVAIVVAVAITIPVAVPIAMPIAGFCQRGAGEAERQGATSLIGRRARHAADSPLGCQQ